MLVAGLYVLGLTLLRRDRAVPLAVVSAALAVVALGRALVLGLDEPQIRPYAAVVVALIAAIVGLLLVLVPRLSTPPTLPRLRTPGRPFVGALAGIVVALVAVPWSQPPPVNLDYFGLDPDRADLELSQWQSIAQAIQAWVAQNWTTARAMGTAVAFVLLLVFVDAVMETARRRSRRWGTVSLSVMVVGLGYWLLVAGAAVGVLYSHPFGPTGADQPILRSVAVVVGAVAAAAVVESLRRALPVTALVGASAMWVAAVALALVSTGIRAFDDPDLRGALLALPLAITGLCAWWLTRPRPPSSWWTIAPALGMAFAIPTLAVVSDLISHTALGASVDDRYRIRVVVLLTLAAAGAVVGARERLAGVFWPAMLCLLVVVLTQLGEVARFVPQWVSLGTVGVVLVLTGARWEDVRTSGRRTNHWASGMR